MAPIPSNPALFQVTPDISQNLFFAIPAVSPGSYVAGYWSLSGAISQYTGGDPLVIETGASANALNFGPLPGIGFFTVGPIAVTSAQLADINAAAGAHLSALFAYVGTWVEGVSVTTLSLTLVQSGGGGGASNFFASSFSVSETSGCSAGMR